MRANLVMPDAQDFEDIEPLPGCPRQGFGVPPVGIGKPQKLQDARISRSGERLHFKKLFSSPNTL
jgi:hypothetical protein